MPAIGRGRRHASCFSTAWAAFERTGRTSPTSRELRPGPRMAWSPAERDRYPCCAGDTDLSPSLRATGSRGTGGVQQSSHARRDARHHRRSHGKSRRSRAKLSSVRSVFSNQAAERAVALILENYLPARIMRPQIAQIPPKHSVRSSLKRTPGCALTAFRRCGSRAPECLHFPVGSGPGRTGRQWPGLAGAIQSR